MKTKKMEQSMEKLDQEKQNKKTNGRAFVAPKKDVMTTDVVQKGIGCPVIIAQGARRKSTYLHAYDAPFHTYGDWYR